MRSTLLDKLVADGVGAAGLVAVFLTVIAPLMRQRAVVAARGRRLAAFQRRRGSVVITIIHRQEQIGLFGVPLVRFIDIDDSEAVLRAIRLTRTTRPIDLVLHTPGGLVLAAEQIAHAVRAHPAKVTVFVPHYAMCGGTLIALAADEIRMDAARRAGAGRSAAGRDARRVDPARGREQGAGADRRPVPGAGGRGREGPAPGALVRHRPAGRPMEPEKARELADLLAGGYFTHDFPITVERARELGMPVKAGLPERDLRPDGAVPPADRGRPSVTTCRCRCRPGRTPGRRTYTLIASGW